VTSYSALSPVSTAVYSALNVSGVTSLATGGVGDDIAQGSGYPFVLYTVNSIPAGGLGTQPGRVGQLEEVSLRLQVFSQYAGAREAQSIEAATRAALFTAFDPVSPTVSVTGYATCALFWDATSEPFDSLVAGVKVKEIVTDYRVFVEAT
jgi:hypothetical protein